MKAQVNFDSLGGGGYPNFYFEPIKPQSSGTFNIGFKAKKIYTFSCYSAYSEQCRSCVYDEDVSTTNVVPYVNGNAQTPISIGQANNVGNIMAPPTDTSITLEIGGVQNGIGFIALG